VYHILADSLGFNIYLCSSFKGKIPILFSNTLRHLLDYAYKENDTSWNRSEDVDMHLSKGKRTQQLPLCISHPFNGAIAELLLIFC